MPQKLVKNSLPAERKRGLVFSETFESADAVRANGGRIFGTPTFSEEGIVLNGTTDYVSYSDLPSTVMYGAEWSFVFEFTPTFAHDDGNTHFFMDTTSGSEYALRKAASGANNAIGVEAGGSNLGGCGAATYGQYWNTNGRNFFAISSTTGNSQYYINGSDARGSADTAAWSKAAPTTLFLGANSETNSFFTGTIHSVKVFNKQLTTQELIDYSNGEWANYINETRGDWPLDMANHDIDNLQALDVSGNGYHLNFGTGSAATRPTKNTTEQGYYIDGNDFLDSNTGLGITDYPVTMSLMFRTKSQGLVGIIDLADTGSASRNMGIYLNVDEVVQAQMRNPTFNTAGTIVGDHGNWIHGVCTFTSATERSIYINGEFDATSTTSTAFFTPDRFTIGRFGDLTPGANFVGDAAKARAWDVALTPLQIADLAIRDIKQINDI